MTLASLNLALVSFALPELQVSWDLETWQLALPLTVAALGGVAGSGLAGQLADRFGRRVVFQVSVATFATASLVSAAAPNLLTLCLAQGAVGLGVNGLSPAVTSMITEMAPTRERGRMTALLESFWVVGGLLAAVAAFLLIPWIGWRGLFVFGGIGIPYAVLVGAAIPESPRYLLSRGRIAEALTQGERIEQRWNVSIPLPSAGLAIPVPLTAGERFRVLWEPAYRRRTVCLWSLWFAQVFSYRGIISWLPTFFVLAGHSAADARTHMVLISLAQLPGTVAVAFLVDHLGRKPLLVGNLAACAVAALAFGMVSDNPVLSVVVAMVIGVTNLGSYAVTLVYTPELYPTRARATGIGMASSFGRIAAIVAPLGVGGLLAAGGGSLFPIFAVFAAVLGLGAGAVGILGPETSGEGLERLSG
jgi:putative MFS transporter